MYSLLLFSIYFFFFFFDDTSTSEIYTLSLHDALPILAILAALTTLGIFVAVRHLPTPGDISQVLGHHPGAYTLSLRSEEHTSELQSHSDLVCRLLLEKKKKQQNQNDK